MAASIYKGNVLNLSLDVLSKWPKSNYDDPPEKTWLPIYSGTLFAMGTVMFGARMWLRLTRQAGNPGWDDVFMVLAWPGTLALFTSVCILAEQYQLGRSVWNIWPFHFTGIALHMWIIQFTFLYAQCCIKLSVMFLYRRLVRASDNPWYLRSVHAAMFVNVMHSVAFMIVLVFNCNPTNAYWKAFDFTYEVQADYHCLHNDTTTFNFLIGAFGIITDLYVAILPLCLSRTLGLNRRQIIALNFAFTLGLFASVANGFKTYFLYQAGAAIDITSNLYWGIVAGDLELQIGMMCVNAPVFRVFVRKYLIKPVTQVSFSTRNKSRNDTLDGDTLPIRPNSDFLNDQFSSAHLEKGLDPESPCSDRLDSKFAMDTKFTMDARIEEADPPVLVVADNGLIRTPTEYEAYNMRTIQNSRNAVTRSSNRVSFSP